MTGFDRIKTVAVAALLIAWHPAVAGQSIESIADQLAAKPAITCADKLPDGTCADQPSSRQMVLPGASPRVISAATKQVRANISMTFLIGSADLTAEAKSTLKRFATRLLQLPAIRPFTVEGHTDRSGPADKNLALSQARANSVVTYLSDEGVDRTKLTAKGYGFNKPLSGVPADSPRNRRVEVVAD